MSLEALFVNIPLHSVAFLCLWEADPCSCLQALIPSSFLLSRHCLSFLSHRKGSEKETAPLMKLQSSLKNSLRQQTEWELLSCPASPCSGLTQEGAGATILPGPFPSPQCHLSTPAGDATSLLGTGAAMLCHTAGHRFALLLRACSTLQVQFVELPLEGETGRAVLCQHLLWGTSFSLNC